MIAELQQERKLNEREPIDWETYRQALIDSGMVDEAQARWRDFVTEHAALFGCNDPGNCGCT